MRWLLVSIIAVIGGCSAITNVDELRITGYTDGDTDTDTDSDSDGDSDSDSDSDTDALECDPSVEDWNTDWAAKEAVLLDELNVFRASGVDCGTEGYFDATSPLDMEYHLQCAARVHAKWLVDNDTTGHDSPGGPLGDTPEERVENAEYDGVFTGESIAFNPDAQIVAEAMIAAPEHCARFMNPDTNHTGIGYAYNSSATEPQIWVMLFGQGD